MLRNKFVLLSHQVVSFLLHNVVKLKLHNVLTNDRWPRSCQANGHGLQSNFTTGCAILPKVAPEQPRTTQGAHSSAQCCESSQGEAGIAQRSWKIVSDRVHLRVAAWTGSQCWVHRPQKLLSPRSLQTLRLRICSFSTDFFR